MVGGKCQAKLGEGVGIEELGVRSEELRDYTFVIISIAYGL